MLHAPTAHCHKGHFLILINTSYQGVMSHFSIETYVECNYVKKQISSPNFRERTL